MKHIFLIGYHLGYKMGYMMGLASAGLRALSFIIHGQCERPRTPGQTGSTHPYSGDKTP